MRTSYKGVRGCWSHIFPEEIECGHPGCLFPLPIRPRGIALTYYRLHPTRSPPIPRPNFSSFVALDPSPPSSSSITFNPPFVYSLDAHLHPLSIPYVDSRIQFSFNFLRRPIPPPTSPYSPNPRLITFNQLLRPDFSGSFKIVRHCIALALKDF